MSIIESKIIQIVKEVDSLGIPIEDLTVEDELILVGINSISFIKIVVGIETEFEFEFNDEDLDFGKFKTIKDLVVYVKNHKDNII